MRKEGNSSGATPASGCGSGSGSTLPGISAGNAAGAAVAETGSGCGARTRNNSRRNAVDFHGLAMVLKNPT